MNILVVLIVLLADNSGLINFIPMPNLFTVSMEVLIETELPLGYLQEHLEICLNKYWVSDIIPDGESQSVTQDGMTIVEYAEFHVSVEDLDS